MKKTGSILLSAIAILANVSPAQESVGKLETLKVAAVAYLNTPELKDAPVQVDVDLKNAFAVRQHERGCLLIPETKLAQISPERLGEELTPIGQLWLRGISLYAHDDRIPAEKVRHVTLQTDNDSAQADLFLLALRKSGEKVELLVFGAGREPVLTVECTAGAATSADKAPLSVIASEAGDGTADVTLQIAGKLSAKLSAGKSD